ncbi:MAG: hypothetical protein CSA38_02125 [Flavobacteriales bacterium]|nr:MAG: hypothetical protein CSA38_02125 [Flavobacteriales bacterium]
MQFLSKIIHQLLEQNEDLGNFHFVLPGKRPVVFIKKILEEKAYSGFLPEFITIDDLIKEIAECQPIDGISLWLNAYEIYHQTPISPKDNFNDFLKWFPTLAKDWDDILKFTEDDKKVLEFMLDEERIKNWAQHLGDEEVPRQKFLNFWQNMNIFLPILKEKFSAKNWATSGLIHQIAKGKIKAFVEKTERQFIFCGFNALTPIEEKLIKNLLEQRKAECFFQADEYYFKDEKQEAGKFLRPIKNWKQWDKNRPFSWVENEFSQPKNIEVFEVSGNVSQTKILPEILENCQKNDKNLSNTAIILLDENLLPASLDAIKSVDYINITMGFPVKNLNFSNAIKAIFHLQKQLTKKTSYYYKDVLGIIEVFPTHQVDNDIIKRFKHFIEERNIVYISDKILVEYLKDLSYFAVLKKSDNIHSFLDELISICYQLKMNDLDDINFENITHFENAFRIIKNQIKPFSFEIDFEILEVLVNQIVHSETIDFQGEPLNGLQIMGLLETRLLNFKNVILLSVNEGKLPLGNTQNTYLPFDVRRHFEMHTFLENDGIYAYHFYRLLQGSENIYLSYNALSSGVNTGEKSRFIRQIELESPHQIQHTVIENFSEPNNSEPIKIEKTPKVLEKLEEWKSRVSASHLTTYLYNPIDFYMYKILKIKEGTEIEEELSQRNYGNLVHFTLEFIYQDLVGQFLTKNNLAQALKSVDENLEKAIIKLQHQKEFYEKGINFIHRSIAKKVIENIIKKDMELVESGNQLRILELEKNFGDIKFLEDNPENQVAFYGFIDRIDELNGTIRIIDYKTAKTKNLNLKITENNIADYLMNNDRKQALQLAIYEYALKQIPEYKDKPLITGIWSFAEANKGFVPLDYTKGNLDDAMVSIRHLILEILNPNIPFVEKV